jgi:hypothetical protein
MHPIRTAVFSLILLSALAALACAQASAQECKPFNAVREVLIGKDISSASIPKVQNFSTMVFDEGGALKTIEYAPGDALVPYCDIENVNYHEKASFFTGEQGRNFVGLPVVKDGSIDLSKAGLQNAFSKGLGIKTAQACSSLFCSCSFKLTASGDGEPINLDLQRKTVKESKARQGVLAKNESCVLEEAWFGEYRAREGRTPGHVLENCRTDLQPGQYVLNFEAKNVEPKACNITTTESCTYNYDKNSSEAGLELQKEKCIVSREYNVFEVDTVIRGLHDINYSKSNWPIEEEFNSWDEIAVLGTNFFVRQVTEAGIVLELSDELPAGINLSCYRGATFDSKTKLVQIFSIGECLLTKYARNTAEKKYEANARLRFQGLETRAEYPYQTGSLSIKINEAASARSFAWYLGREVLAGFGDGTVSLLQSVGLIKKI